MVTMMTLFAHAMQRFRPDWPDDVYAGVVTESAARPVLINALGQAPLPGQQLE